jgi:methionyl-tRNA formyltransferase
MRLLVLSTPSLSEFQVQTLEPLFGSDRIQVVGAVVDARRGPGLLARLTGQLKKGRGGYVLVLACHRLRRACLRRGLPDAATFFRCRRVPVHQAEDLYSPDTLAFIRDRGPDCIFRMGFGIIRQPVLSAAPRGVISFHHGDIRKYRGMPPAFWELYHGEGEMAVTVQALNERLDGGRIVKQVPVPIGRRDSWSSLSRRAMAAGTAMIRDACLLLDDPAFEPEEVPADQLGRLYSLPNLRQWLALQAKVLLRRLTTCPPRRRSPKS